MMKLNKYIYGVALGALSLSFASCYNADKEFPDNEGGTTAYFAYQNPVRTLILGNDIYPNDLDNQHKCQIWATMGGAYNGRDAYAEIAVVDTLCDNLYFQDAGGNAAGRVLPLPADYYNLSSNVIRYDGNHRGYVEVQFTDKFFNDLKSIENTYVIPLLMKNVTGIDHILRGKKRQDYDPQRVNSEEWEVLPMDYVLYCVKYKNPWDAYYIRRGVDKVTEKDVTKEFVRKDMSLVNSDLEHLKENPVNANDEVVSVKTKNMNQVILPVSLKRVSSADASLSCNLILQFVDNKCTISTDDDNVTATGTGEFITKGTELPAYKDYQWGSLEGEKVHRDILRLSYDVTVKAGKVIGKDDKGKDIVLANDVQVSTADTLVVRDRDSNKKEFFPNIYVKK